MDLDQITHPGPAVRRLSRIQSATNQHWILPGVSLITPAETRGVDTGTGKRICGGVAMDRVVQNAMDQDWDFLLGNGLWCCGLWAGEFFCQMRGWRVLIWGCCR